MKRIIVTGFNPFGTYRHNPTQDIAEHYNGMTIDGVAEVLGIVLPATYFTAFHMLEDAMRSYRPHAVISLGLASSAKGIKFEKRFKNLMYSKYTDADGLHPDNLPIMEGSLNYEESNAKNNFLAGILKQRGIRACTSKSADTYICNSLGYLTSRHIRISNIHTQNIFLHIPWTTNYEEYVADKEGKVFIDKEDIYRALNIIIKSA